MVVIEFEIPGRLQAKQRPRYVRTTGHIYTPRETVNAESYVKTYFASKFHTHRPFTGPVYVELEFYRVPPISWAKWKRQAAIDGIYIDDRGADLDNRIKTVLDALNHVAFHDDRQIFGLLARKGFTDRDYTYVRIQAHDQAIKPIGQLHRGNPVHV